MAVRVEVERATAAHAADLAARMRAADREEVRASGDHTPLEALQMSLERTAYPVAGLFNGRVECIFGVSNLWVLGSIGVPWLLGSETLPLYARPFLRESRRYVDAMRDRFRLLTNHVDARNEMSIRWLKWLGFAIMSPEPFGPFGLPFHRFEWRAGNV